jgi:hypothetical protein
MTLSGSDFKASKDCFIINGDDRSVVAYYARDAFLKTKHNSRLVLS